MREIKFRVWDSVSIKDVKRLVFKDGNVDAYVDKKVYLRIGSEQINPEWSLMQYTGLKDKNGVEIYEGDIILEYWHLTQEPETNAIVYYKNGFYLDNGIHSNWDSETVEVIGNIYENPELLETK